MSILTEGDRRFLPLLARESGGWHLAVQWYFNGWNPMPYQYVWHHVTAMNGVWIGGIATSKTSTSAASYMSDCLAYPYFRALNTSVTAKQAELPFQMAMGWIENNKKLEHLIDNIRQRPWPVITFTNGSSYEFRTAGLDARFIRGFEYDRINYDECALDPTGKTAEVLRGRLRGKRENGVTRFARLDMVTSPGAVLWLREKFEKGQKPDKRGPDRRQMFFSMKTATWDNIHLTKDQIEAMMEGMPPEIVAVELGAEWPDYGMAYFPEKYIDAAINQDLYDQVYISLNPEDPSEKPKPGYRLEEDPRIGPTLFEMPYIPGHRYILAGDPGRFNPPNRNAGVVMVADITNVPMKRLVFLHWVSGNGSIRPFLNAYRYAFDKYYPEMKGLDVTGTQAMMDEIAFKESGIPTDGVNYSHEKHPMLSIHLNELTSSRWEIPPIQGLVRQSKVYTLEEDEKIPQDLITTWAQLSWLARHIQNTPEVQAKIEKDMDYTRRMRPAVRAGTRTPVRRSGTQGRSGRGRQ